MKYCLYCGSITDIKFKISSSIFHQCRKCDLIFRGIQKDYQEILAAYSREDFFDRYTCGQIFGKREKLYDHILDSLEVKNSHGRLLDVGTGCGFFLTAAERRGWYVKGIDPSRQSVEVARYQNKLDVFHGSLKEYFDDDQFDAITFINVLDHSAEPWTEIKLASNLLKSGGITYFRFPNGYLHAHLYQMASKCRLSHRIRRFLVFHQFSFTPKFIQRLLADSGYSNVLVMNSPPSEGDPHNLFSGPALAQYIKRSLFFIAQAIRSFSRGKLLLGTSLEVIAIKIDEFNDRDFS